MPFVSLVILSTYFFDQPFPYSVDTQHTSITCKLAMNSNASLDPHDMTIEFDIIKLRLPGRCRGGTCNVLDLQTAIATSNNYTFLLSQTRLSKFILESCSHVFSIGIDQGIFFEKNPHKLFISSRRLLKSQTTRNLKSLSSMIAASLPFINIIHSAEEYTLCGT